MTEWSLHATSLRGLNPIVFIDPGELKMAANTKLQNLSKDELLRYIDSQSEQLSRYEIRFRGEVSSRPGCAQSKSL